MDSLAQHLPVCANCLKAEVKLKVCGSCKKVNYCSAQCQKSHWKKHKPTCKGTIGVVKNPEEDSGVFMKVSLGGQEVAVEPGKLKKMFEDIVKKHGFDKGSRADEIADFLTGDEVQTVTPSEFATRFNIPVEDAGTFLAWINIGVSFKEQALDPHSKNTSSLSQNL